MNSHKVGDRDIFWVREGDRPYRIVKHSKMLEDAMTALVMGFQAEDDYGVGGGSGALGHSSSV